MANTLDVSCPSCQKQIKASAELQGKKVRCKGCGHIFVIEAPAAAAKPGPESKSAPVKIGPKQVTEEGYAVSGLAEDAIPRCPHCAMEMASAEAVICIHCGYNTQTRQRIATKKTYETTAADRSRWLMPGFASIGGIFILIFFDLFFCMALPRMVDESSDWVILTYGGVRLWVVIFSILIMLALGKFAYGRLIQNPNPPEQLRH
jgi:hypothetical protein